MSKYIHLLILAAYSLILVWFFKVCVVKDISAISERDCQTLAPGKKLRLENRPFFRILRLKGNLSDRVQVKIDSIPLNRSNLLKRKGDLNYFALPPGKNTFFDLNVEPFAAAEACTFNYFAYSKNRYLAVFKDYPKVSSIHPPDGYFLFLSLLALAFIAVLFGSPAVYSLSMAPAVILVTALAFIPQFYGIKVYIAFPLFAKLTGFSLLAALSYQFRKTAKDAMMRHWRFGLWEPLKHSWVQRAIIIFVVTFIFWNGLWSGAPRADQIPYLHQISQFNDLWQILWNSPSWNRTQSAGDFILFRPVLYWLLGTFYYFFRYNFLLWQISALLLHILVISGIYSLLTIGRLRKTQYPFLISLFFGTAILSSELVLWNHMVGYLLFSVLSVFLIYFLVRFFDTQKTHLVYLSLFLGLLAEFTYEAGVVVNLLISITFFYRFLFKHVDADDVPPKETGKNIKWAALFLSGALLYPVLSFIDLRVRGIVVSTATDAQNITHPLLLASWYAIKQIAFWIGGWLLPAAYKISAAARANFNGFKSDSPLFLVNCAFVIVFISTIGLKISSLKEKRRELYSGAGLSFLMALCFLFAYSFIIAYGRALPRGLDYVFIGNIYYSYIAYLVIVVSIGLLSSRNGYSGEAIGTSAEKTTGVNSNPDLSKNRVSSSASLNLLTCSLIVLISFNMYAVVKLTAQYRYDYSAPRQEVINAVTNWRNRAKSSQEYFTSNCSGNDPLPWFNLNHIRKGSEWTPPVRLADALWPEKSYTLNKRLLIGKNFSVSDIKCSAILNKVSTDHTNAKQQN